MALKTTTSEDEGNIVFKHIIPPIPAVKLRFYKLVNVSIKLGSFTVT